MKNCTIKRGGKAIFKFPQSEKKTESPKEKTEVEKPKSKYPKEKDYIAVVEWLEEEKKEGRDHYADARNNRAKMCRNISDILGWDVDRNSLGKVMNNTYK